MVAEAVLSLCKAIGKMTASHWKKQDKQVNQMAKPSLCFQKLKKSAIFLKWWVSCGLEQMSEISFSSV